jgi:hypothetical protein
MREQDPEHESEDRGRRDGDPRERGPRAPRARHQAPRRAPCDDERARPGRCSSGLASRTGEGRLRARCQRGDHAVGERLPRREARHTGQCGHDAAPRVELRRAGGAAAEVSVSARSAPRGQEPVREVLQRVAGEVPVPRRNERRPPSARGLRERLGEPDLAHDAVGESRGGTGEGTGGELAEIREQDAPGIDLRRAPGAGRQMLLEQVALPAFAGEVALEERLDLLGAQVDVVASVHVTILVRVGRAGWAPDGLPYVSARLPVSCRGGGAWLGTGLRTWCATSSRGARRGRGAGTSSRCRAVRP